MNTLSAVVNCSVYRSGRKIGDITVEDISEVLREDDTFVWVGLLEPDFELLRKMQEEFNLHELAVEDARNAHQRPKLEEYGETLFLVLHTAHLSADTIQFGETHIFIGPRFVLTVRHGASSSYKGVRERCEHLPDRLAKGPGYVLYAIVDFVVDQYQPCIDHLQQQFHTFERELFTPGAQKNNLQDFYELKNKLLILQAAVSPLIDICTRLLRFHSDIIPKDIRVYFRDILDHVARVTQASDRMQEMINAAMQVALAQVTIRQNEVVKRLAGWGAILAVPTMVFSLYGMNFKFMPELEWKWSYPAIMGVIVAGCVVLYRRLRKVGWL
ncbi:magnesium/cobalt transporter CorA [Noviherbaspirillum saxi]|uniref:Magnesium transport protein CorA n=1 Tax=Noviherbaspirillum saxi TaxID=2320863 RepID=A0A3A3FGS5_9BURK|nr:magnesium/cobalt transporter CorA [Noviherbaspirillum saxi]RJF92337.1 magnesium and cobalt transport protein CorA [Noviherbaspirillum saxi]